MPNKTQDYGDIRVTMTSEFGFQYDDQGTGCKFALEMYHAVSQGGMRPLGSMAFGTYHRGISGKRGTILVGNVPGAPGRPACAAPLGYDFIWNDSGTGGVRDGTIWRPQAPEGYVSLGDICVGHYNEPSKDLVWCIREDLTFDSTYKPKFVWDDTKSGGKLDCSVWDIAQPTLPPTGAEMIPIRADTFRAIQAYHFPPSHLARVLALPCPKNFDAFPTTRPQFTKDTLPAGGQTFNTKAQCEIILPYSAFLSATDTQSLNHITDPFIVLSKSAAWFVHRIRSNEGGGSLKDTTSVTKGISSTQTSEMTHSAGVSISASYGIMGFGAEVSLNYQFTSTNSNSFTDYTETTNTVEVTVPPHEAYIYLIRHVWIKACRRGSSVDLHQVDFHANDDLWTVGVKLD
ncbi:hypothetical protein B5807_00795 [Epicoccum nigrum]|jgi:hypothetical protein|uniref:Insecticidal crystal toxin domain-containing protein n=1 Tax=Epicoccum nigrum TaxID=105696 RepID=A0A1Y2MG60_EPING|nr:hypothetical protein B5807_00795 [Epicoccum nigrum]